MGKKFKSFATLLVALSTAFSIAALVSCNDDTETPVDPNTSETTKTLVSIAITQEPTITTFTVNQTFRTTGLEVTATYSDSSTAVVTGYSVSSPDMTTAGQKTVEVSYTEGEVTATTSYTITVEEDSYQVIYFDTSYTIEVGMEIASLNPTVYAQMDSGGSVILTSDEYTLTISDGTTTVTDGYVQGETTYTFTATLNEDDSLTATTSYTTGSADSFRFEAEDAEVDGPQVLQPNHSDSNFSWDTTMGLVVTSSGNSFYPGTVSFTVYALEGTYDLSFNVSNTAIVDTALDYESWQLRDGTPSGNYIQLPHAVNDTVDLEVNGEVVSIPDTSVYIPTVESTAYRELINTFQVVDIANVSLKNGANTFVFTFGESKSGVTSIVNWPNGSPTFNVDYFQFEKAEPDETKTISSIELETEPYVQTYNQVTSNDDVDLDTSGMLIKVNYEDDSYAYVCTNFETSYDFTSIGQQTVTVTYGGKTTSYEVTVRGDPDSISIDESFELYGGDDLTNLDLTVYATYDQTTSVLETDRYEVTVTDENDGEVTETTAILGNTYKITVTYQLNDGSYLTDSITRSVDKMYLYAEDATYTVTNVEDRGSTSNSTCATGTTDSNTSVRVEIKLDGDTANVTFTTDSSFIGGTYNLALDLFNGKVFDTRTDTSTDPAYMAYTPSDMNLDNVLDITINGTTEVDMTDKVLPAFENLANSSSVMYYATNLLTVDFGNVTLEDGENTISCDVRYSANEINRWSAVLIGFDACVLSPASASE